MTSYMQRIIDDRVEQELAKMGGDLLSTYGKSTDPDDKPKAWLGGYLLERFGKGETLDEPDGTIDTTGGA